MRLTRYLGRWTVVLLWVFFITIPVAQANQAVVVIGIGADRDGALHDAMRNAIEQKIGLILDSQTIVQNYQTLSDTIYTHSEGYVTDYTILSEAVVDGQYSLTVQVVVSAALDATIMDRFQKVKAVETGLQDPRLGVVVIDQQGEEYAMVQNSLTRVLQDNGFSRIVDLNQVELVNKQQLLAAVFQGQNSLAKALQTKFPVDYMVVGNVDVLSAHQAASRGFQAFMSGQAVLSLRVYNMNTGEIVYADSVNGGALHTNRDMAMNNALKKAAENAGPALGQALLKKATNPINHIRLIVTEAKLGNINTAQQRLSHIAGVSQVYLRSSSFDSMIFDLNYYGSAVALANALDNAGIIVQEISSEFVKI